MFGEEPADPPIPAAAGRLGWLTVGVIFAGALIRFLFLNADPAYYAWAGYVTDEGRWTQQGRELALFGSPDLRYWLSVVHLAIAPLFQAASWVSFELLGVSLASARAVSAVFGTLLLVAVWRYLRPRLTSGGTLVAIVAIGLQADLIFLSRIAVPEMAVMLFEFLSFAVLVTGPRTALRAFVAGLIMAVGLGFKGTDLPIVFVLALVAAAVHERDDPSSRRAKVAAFAGAVFGSAALVLLVAPVLTDQDVMGPLAAAWPSLATFTRLASQYSAATFLLYGDHTVALNVALLAGWLIAGILFGAGRLPRHAARAFYIGSWVWVAAWIAAAVMLGYFPERYVFHVLVPLALNVGAGLTLLGALGDRGAIAVIERVGGVRRVVCAAWLALPLAVLCSPLVIDLASLTGVSMVRFAQRVAVIGGLTILGTLAALAIRTPRATLYVFCAFPAGVAVLWVLAGTSRVIAPSFWPVEGEHRPFVWVAVLALAALGTWSLAVLSARRPPLLAPASLIAISFGLVGLVQAAPSILRPTYTLQRAGEALERSLSGYDAVWTHRAATVFLANGLKYREVEDSAPELVVSMFGLMSGGVDASYEIVEEYEIRLGRVFLDRHPDTDPVLKVLRRVP